MTNRIWHHMFSEPGSSPPVVISASRARRPAIRALFEWLAAEFVEPTTSEVAPWSMKSMIRTLVMSDAFRRSNHPTEAGLDADAGAFLALALPSSTG